MKKITIMMFVLLMSASGIFAQKESEEGKEEKFGIRIRGFVKTDIIHDSRQTVAVREGHFLLYPKAEDIDVSGEDCNARASFNILSVQTRVAGLITAPSFLGAKSSGYIEAAFFGHSELDINGLRLRHAFLKLDWPKSSLLVGQYWHPMFITEVFPGVVSFNTGVPFQPFARNPQIRFVHRLSNVDVSLTAASQRDFVSTGPLGASSVYLRDAAIPILDLNVKYGSRNLVAGVGANVKSIAPRIVTEQGYRTDNKVTSYAGMAFAKVVTKDVTMKFQGIYGKNLTDLVMLGGYAVSSFDQETGIEEYTCLKTVSSWAEIITGKSLQFALFGGYTKNLGADSNITGPYYARGSNISNVMRIAPRAQYRLGSTAFALELEYTSAAYGQPDIKGVVENTQTVNNLRLLFGTYIFF